MMTDRKTYAEQLFGSAAAGQTLTEGEELLAAFLRSSNVGVGILDSNVRYLAVNKVLAEMSGVPAQNHLGRTVREVLGEIGELIEHKFSQVLATRQGLKFEVSGKVPSRGESRHWIIDMFPIPSRQDSVTRIGAIVYELTTPRQLEQSLQQLDGQLRRETNAHVDRRNESSFGQLGYSSVVPEDIGAASPGATPGICQFCPARRRDRPAGTSCDRFSAR